MKRSGPWEAYKRWRHSKGFGVHSPFAYSLVTEALWPARGYGWYGEREIEMEALKPGARFTRRDVTRAKRMLRLMAFLKTLRVVCDTPDPLLLKAASQIPAEWFSEIPASGLKPGDLLVVKGSGTLPDAEGICRLALVSGVHVVAVAPSDGIRALLMSPSDSGLRLEGPTAVVAVSRPGMAFTTYTLPL